MKTDHLKLNRQFSFSLYLGSRLLIKEYQPFLDKLNLTYPQYLVLLVLWENNNLSVNEISAQLLLNSNTLTPMLKRMEKDGLINRVRSVEDERKVMILLTAKGEQLSTQASSIPTQIIKEFTTENYEGQDELETLKKLLDKFINVMRMKGTAE